MAQKVLFLTSGKGKNIALDATANFADRLSLDISVVSHEDETSGEEIAQKYSLSFIKIPSKKLNGEWENGLLDVFEKEQPDMTILLYNRLIPETVINAQKGILVNIHPSLLPAFTGFKAVDKAIEYGSKVTGVTAHLVDNTVDQGRPLIQSIIPLRQTVKSYSDIATVLDEHNVAITLQLLFWLRNGLFTKQEGGYVVSDEQYDQSSFYPNLSTEVEEMTKEYFSQ